jgi:hypothetical protein
VVKIQEDLSIEAVAGPQVLDRIRQLRIEVAVLEEQLAAAEQVVVEREQHIKDLRAALRVMWAAAATQADRGTATGRG